MTPSSATRKPLISKSKYLSGLQCLKLLWFYYNRKDQIPPIDAATQAVFDQGHVVGEYANRLFPNGIEIQREHSDIPGVVEDSKKALAHRRPIFEAGFEFNGGFARADVLNPVAEGQWDLIEVKSSTEVKDVHLYDAAFQLYVYKNAGIEIRKVFVYCINNQYVRHGAIEPEKLFASWDISVKVNELVPGISSNVARMQQTINQAQCPEIKIGPHCTDPYGCPLIGICWEFLPPQNVTTLYRGGKKRFYLLDVGITEIKSVPADMTLTPSQKIQKEAVISGRPHVDQKAIGAFLQSLEYPLFYLDFETFDTAIPLYDDVRPYLKVPFQYSLHIQRKPDVEPEHYSYLATGETDPRPEILANLQELLGKSGSIVVYNQSFEKGVLRSCCEFYPDYADWVGALETRFVDLLAPFRSFYYYHPDQNGSASIKDVLPALTGSGYEGMDIQDGNAASREYLRVTFTAADEADRRKVRRQLEDYCTLDTYAMVVIVAKLRDLISH